MPWIKNVAMYVVEKGLIPPDTDVIISIVDPDMEHPFCGDTQIPQHNFKFLDVDDEHYLDKIKQSDAAGIAAILKTCLENKQNVLVHCHMGICRSGAVTECGVILGFDDTGEFRSPNVLVKKMILKELGLTNSWDDE